MPVLTTKEMGLAFVTFHHRHAWRRLHWLTCLSVKMWLANCKRLPEQPHLPIQHLVCTVTVSVPWHRLLAILHDQCLPTAGHEGQSGLPLDPCAGAAVGPRSAEGSRMACQAVHELPHGKLELLPAP